MLGIGSVSKGKVVAVADIGSASAGFAVFETGSAPRLVSYARENLPFESRDQGALAAGVIQALSSAAAKALEEHTRQKGPRVSGCYAVIGAPWTRSFAAAASAKLQGEVPVTDKMIGELAKRALSEQTHIDPKTVFEANVMNVLLNGYPTNEPAGKRASEVSITALLSDCDPAIQSGAKDAIGKALPGAQVVWRSSARAALAVTKASLSLQNCLIVEVGGEATDLTYVRKGALEDRASLPQGVRQIASSLIKGKPVEEVLSLLDMVEKQQSEAGAGTEIEQSVAKVEPELAHAFGETLSKLTASRKLPETLVLIAPPQLSLWLSRFFSRIDFTQFISTAQPFSVSRLSAGELLPPPSAPASFADTSLAIACALVNIEAKA